MRNKVTLNESIKMTYQDIDIDQEKFTTQFNEFVDKLNNKKQKITFKDFIKKVNKRPLYKFGITTLLIGVITISVMYFYPKDETLKYQRIIANRQVSTLGQIHAGEAVKLIEAQKANFDRKDIIISFKEESISNQLNYSTFRRVSENINDKSSIRSLTKSVYKNEEDGLRIRLDLNDGNKYITFNDDPLINRYYTYNLKNLNSEDINSYAKCGLVEEGALQDLYLKTKQSKIIDKFNEIRKLDFHDISLTKDENGRELYIVKSDTPGDNKRVIVKTWFDKDDFRLIRQEALYYENDQQVNHVTTNYDYEIYERTPENLRKLFQFNERFDNTFDVKEKSIDCSVKNDISILEFK